MSRADAIYGAIVVEQMMQHIRGGRGAPQADDVRRFAKGADAVVELWRGALQADGPPMPTCEECGWTDAMAPLCPRCAGRLRTPG